MTTETAPRRALRPPRQHDWQDYLDGHARCSACGVRRRTWELRANRPCEGAAKVTIDVE